MGSQTTYECDGCDRSIEDPGIVTEVKVSPQTLRDGALYYSSSHDGVDLELCLSCAANVKLAIKRVLRN